MAITELALLHLKPPRPHPTPDNALLSAIKAQASYASYPVYLFTQLEDPSYIYLLGGWESVSKHMDEWIPSKANQDLIAGLQDDIEVVCLQHVDVDPGDVAAVAAQDDGDGDGDAVIVIVIGRYFITEAARKEQFQNTFAEAIKSRTWKGGWRLDPDVDGHGNFKGEFVFFGGLNAFEDSEAFKEVEGIKDFLDGAEIKHTVRWARS